MGHMLPVHTERLLRELSPQVLGILVRRYRDFAGCEDAVQEALIAAATQWPRDGVPDNARGWLIRVATRRLTDQIRADTSRRLREQLVVSLVPADEQIALAADLTRRSDNDETLDLYFMCCHPALSVTSQVALTLRAVGGLSTADIARAFHVPESTMAQRLSRAKATIKDAGKRFPDISASERVTRLPAVLRVLYLAFNEGYAATSGDQVVRLDVSSEAIRVTRMLAQITDEAEVQGLLALMLLTDARREARSDQNGALIPLDEQDRTRWNRQAIAEGGALLDRALSRGAAGPYQVQAAIAALHAQAASMDTTDWPQILSLYTLLLRMHDTPMARLSHAIALSMVQGPAAGLEALDLLASDSRLTGSHRLDAARGHLYERAGDRAQAAAFIRTAASKTTSTAERDYLRSRAARL
jgi:RNA polymerase sigma factor (sigma-70 family)